jgi:hypothetical protein
MKRPAISKCEMAGHSIVGQTTLNQGAEQPRSRLKLREELTKYFGKDARNAMPTGHR